MTNDTAPAWDGVPLNPTTVAQHWLAGQANKPFVAQWEPGIDPKIPWEWRVDGTFVPIHDVATDCRYLGPCHTPAEVAALVDAARREAFNKAAQMADERTYPANPETKAAMLGLKLDLYAAAASPLAQEAARDE